MKILLDISGADKGLNVPIEAAVNLIDKIGVPICLVGKKEDIQKELRKLNKEEYIIRFEILDCSEYITNDDEPVHAIKTKKESNLVKAFEYMKQDEKFVFISSSNTGALMAGALLKLGRIPGIHRPALVSLLPTEKGKDVVLLDTGANPQAKEASLVQYAKLGEIYAKYMLDIPNPRISLLNIGSEEEKGTPELKEVHQKLKQMYPENFIGNIESRYILKGDTDVIVADGLMGNIAIKSLEGAVSTLKNVLKADLSKGLFNKLKGAIVKSSMKDVMSRFNYKEHEGAVLLGVKKPIIKVHGSSSTITYEKALMQAKNLIKMDVIERIEEEINKGKY